MPQNAIIRADGTGDYTSPIAWEAGEQSSNYGSITVGRLDGFFDLGSSNLDFNGTWSNGARLECFSSSTGFDGTERSLCGVTSTNSGMTVRGRSTLVQLAGLEIYNTGTGEPYQSTTGTPNFSHNGCLFHNPTVNVCIPANAASTSLLTNCVTVAKEHSTQVFNHVGCNHFSNTTSSVGSNGGSISNTVVVNALSGGCIRSGVTQSNNATTDSTGDTLTNIVIADNFVSSDPVGDGDYRIKSGSLLDTNGIGSFVEASSGGLTASITESGPSFTEQISTTLSKAIEASITELGPSFTESISSNLSVNITGSIGESGPAFTESISTTLSTLTIQGDIAESGPSFTESISIDVQAATGLNASIAELGPSFTESVQASLDKAIEANISEYGPSFTDSIAISLTSQINASIGEYGPSFIEGLSVKIPVKISVNAKNTIKVKRSANTVKIKRKSNILRVK